MLNRLLMPVFLIIGTIIIYPPAYAQEKPPKPIIVTVSTAQHLSFGTFIQTGDWGTVTISAQQARTASGSIILPNISSIVTAALFEVEAIPGTLITIVNGPDAPLTGSKGGTIWLKVEASSTGSPFLTTGDRTSVFIGGTLTVGPLATNPAGIYRGDFQVTFIQQ
jgi:hypothetical protein